MFNRLDSGIRLGTLVRPSMALYKSPSMTPQALKIMIEHAWRLGNWFNSQRKWHRNHNYGSSYIAGLGSLAYQFQELRDAAAWWEKNNGRALYYTSKGMYASDHSFLEGNTAYGPMVLGFLNRYRRQAIKTGVELPDQLVENFRGIARYAMDVSDPSGVLYPYGDTFSPHSYNLDVIRGIAEDHNNPELLFLATDGKAGSRPARTSAWYPFTKLGIMRTAWVDENALGLFVNALNGGNHWHPNTLSLCAYGYGNQLLDDTYYYGKRVVQRPGINTTDHNTVAINGQRQSDGGAADGRMIINPRYDLFDGYTDATKGFRHRRHILLLKSSKFWIVSDRLHAKAKPEAVHRYNQTWHPRPASGVAIEEQTKLAATAFPHKGNIKIVPADPQELNASLQEGWWSSERTPYVSYEKETKGSATFDTVLYPMPEGEDAEVTVTRLDTGVPTTEATALQIGIEDKYGSRMGWYYLSYEEEPPRRTVGPLSTDTHMVYLESAGDGHPLTLVLEQGSLVQNEGRLVLQADAALDDLAIEWDAAQKVIRLSTASGKLSADLKIVAPFAAKQITLNGKDIDFVQQGEAVEVGE